MELNQKRYTDRRFFRLDKDGVFIKMKSPKEDIETKFKYEELGLGTITVRKKEAGWIFTVFAFVSMIGMKLLLDDYTPGSILDSVFIALCAIVVFGSLFFLVVETRKPLIGITNGTKSFTLHRNTPTKSEVDLFIKELQNRIKRRIIEINVRPDDKTIDKKEKLESLTYLKEQGILDEETYLETQKRIRDDQKKAIGFDIKSDK